MSALKQYEGNVEVSQAVIARGPDVIRELLERSKFDWAAQNCKITAEAYIDLGLLHWRRGIDPRAEFRGAVRACIMLADIVRKHKLPTSDFDIPLIYAAMFLLGQGAKIEFCDEDTYRNSRWACYQSRLVHALHDKPASANLLGQTEAHLAKNSELADRIFDTYFQLLGLRAGKMDLDECVRRAKATWVERKRDVSIPEGRLLDGHGAMNDLYVDIYLGAVLKKIGWTGHTIHAWLWD